MKTTLLETSLPKNLITKSSWPKKQLADYHLEALLFCEFGCQYCSSNAGLHLRFKKQTLNRLSEEATGQPFDAHQAGDVAIAYPNLAEALERELRHNKRKPDAGKTLVYSQLTDGFSPVLLKDGTARQILELLLERTKYRIRVLTKNSIVGNSDWVEFFSTHADRFVVGLSIGTLDDRFARSLEWRTSTPMARVKALQALQAAGVPTYGMLCPVFPQVLETDELERLLDGIQPQLCEHVWAEPYNNRQNWQVVREVYEPESWGWDWMTEVYERKHHAVWSRYTTRLYQHIYEMAVAEGWSDKRRYLLYEDQITAEDAPAFQGLDGVLLQCNPGQDGRSPHPYFANLPAAS